MTLRDWLAHSADAHSHLAGGSPVGIGWRHAHYRRVLEELPRIDFLEVHSENFFAAGGAALATLVQARGHYPVSLHGVGLSLGSACGIDAQHLNQLAQLVERVEPVLVSDHASFARGHLPGQAQPVHGLDLLPIPFNANALQVMAGNVSRVQEHLRRPIAVENLSAYIQWQGSDMSEPEFLNQLAQRTGCRLLVDVNNIYVNALNEQRSAGQSHSVQAAVQTCKQWLLAIEPGHVAELHVAGHMDCGDVVIDDHGSRTSEPVWALYALAKVRFPQALSLIEWDTDVPDLSVLLDEARCARALGSGVPVQEDVLA
jgi:uncharacterized protein